MQQVQGTLSRGSIVGERYQVEELLGKGGFGAVYLVRDLRVRQNVFALKEIADPDLRQRRHFTFEADLLKRTDHPSLPRVYRSFDDPAQGRAYMLMDYIEGPNLETLRRQRPEHRLPLPEVLGLLGPIVEALTYLHNQQPPIVHRDIKPSNIIAPSSGQRTMLVDFGIAKEFDQEGTTTAVRHATPGYGAPEQYGTGTDTRTDIYGLGATLYTLLTGTLPVDAFVRMAQQMSRKEDPLQEVKQLVPSIPQEISQAISRAMALEKTERFATVEEFWQALQPETFAGPVAALPDRGKLAAPAVQVKPYHSTSADPSRAQRGRWIVIALLLLLALGAGFAAALFSLPRLRGQQTSAATTPPAITTTHAVTARPTATPTPSPTATPTPSPTPTPHPTAVPTSSVPTLATTYAGTIHDNNGSIDTTMALRGVNQNGVNIQGTFVVGAPLGGNGPFTGTVNTHSVVRFIVHSSDVGAEAPLFFSGQIQANGGISGQYCSLDSSGNCNPSVGGFGTWSVKPAGGGS